MIPYNPIEEKEWSHELEFEVHDYVKTRSGRGGVIIAKWKDPHHVPKQEWLRALDIGLTPSVWLYDVAFSPDEVETFRPQELELIERGYTPNPIEPKEWWLDEPQEFFPGDWVEVEGPGTVMTPIGSIGFVTTASPSTFHKPISYRVLLEPHVGRGNYIERFSQGNLDLWGKRTRYLGTDPAFDRKSVITVKFENRFDAPWYVYATWRRPQQALREAKSIAGLVPFVAIFNHDTGERTSISPF